MRRVAILTTIIALGWSAYWLAGFKAQQSLLDTLVAQQRATGWTIDIANLKTAGYPNRFDTTFTGLHVADPAGIWAWDAPAFQIMALSYKPNHIIAAWPGKHVVTVNGARYSFESDTARASVRFAPTPRLPLERVQLEATRNRLDGPNGMKATTDLFTLAIARDGEAAEYKLYTALKGGVLAKQWRDVIDPDKLLPDTITAITLDSRLRFNHAWDRLSVGPEVPELQEIRVTKLSLDWGDVTVTGEGSATVGMDGYLQGAFTIHVENWKTLFDTAQAAGFVPEDNAGKIHYGIRLMAALGDNPENVTIPLKFANGNSYFGPLVIAEAPRLPY